MLNEEKYLEFEVEYFHRDNRFIVLDFLENILQKKNIKLFEKSMAMLIELKRHFYLRNNSKSIKYIKRGDFNCFELRVRYKNDICRYLFKIDELNKKFVVLFGFIKKTQKTLSKDIQKAEIYWNEYLDCKYAIK